MTMQQLAEEQPGRAGADDRDLRSFHVTSFHVPPPIAANPVAKSRCHGRALTRSHRAMP